LWDLTKVKKKRVKRRRKRRQGWEVGGRNNETHEDRRWMMRKLGRGQGRKGRKGDAHHGSRVTNENGCRRSLLRRG